MTTEDLDILIGKLESFHWKADCDYCPMRDDCETGKCLLSLAVEAIETLREDKAALEVLLRDRPDMEWIPTAEGLPEEMKDHDPIGGWSENERPSDDVLILLDYTPKPRCAVAWYSHVHHMWVNTEETDCWFPELVSHWMPLPQMPGGDESQ